MYNLKLSLFFFIEGWLNFNIYNIKLSLLRFIT